MTVETCQRPPRRVSMPRAFSSSAMARRLVAPPNRMSSRTGARSRACLSAFAATAALSGVADVLMTWNDHDNAWLEQAIAKPDEIGLGDELIGRRIGPLHRSGGWHSDRALLPTEIGQRRSRGTIAQVVQSWRLSLAAEVA